MAEMSLDLTGKVALVTGGSRGLGRSIAATLAAKGAKIAVCSRKQANLDQATKEFEQMGFEVSTYVANVGEAAQVAGLFEEIKQDFGKLDILVNNVGMNILTPSVATADEALWDKIIQSNLKGTFLTSKFAVPLMKSAGGGKIINISSVAAKKAARGMGIYCVAKAGVEMLTRIMAVELATDNIQVNAVAPGMVKTGFSQPFWSNESLAKEIVRTIPMGRLAETEDVVGAVLFLATGLSDYVTGEVLTVDGGSTS